MNMAYIRSAYHVPAKRGVRVRLLPPAVNAIAHGVITSARGAYLRVRMDDGRRLVVHPTWCIEYLDGEAAAP